MSASKTEFEERAMEPSQIVPLPPDPRHGGHAPSLAAVEIRAQGGAMSKWKVRPFLLICLTPLLFYALQIGHATQSEPAGEKPLQSIGEIQEVRLLPSPVHARGGAPDLLLGPEEMLTIQGHVTYTVYNRSAEVHLTGMERFAMDVNASCHYLIRLVEDRSGSDYFEVGYDGTNSYYLNNMSTIVAAQRAQAPERVGDNVATGIIRASPVPQFSFADCADPLWLAYASRCYFTGRDQNALVAPAASNGGMTGSHLEPNDFIKVPARFTLDADGWLTSLQYLNPPTHLRTGRPLPPPFHQTGFTNAVFTVDQWGALNTGTRIPMKATLNLYRLSTVLANATDARVLKMGQYKVEVTNVFLQSGRSDFRPAVPGLTVMTEQRFNAAEYKGNFNFAYRTNRWLTDAEVRVLPQYQRARALNVAYDRRPGTTAFFFVFALLSVSAVVLLAARYRKR